MKASKTLKTSPPSTLEEPTLFPVDSYIVPHEERTSQQEREARQYARLQLGIHPLQPIIGRSLKLHPQAAPLDDRQAPGRRCGNCRHRIGYGWNSTGGQYPKCWYGWQAGSGTPPPRYTRSAASDCADWWPACVDHDWWPECADPGRQEGGWL